MQGRTNPFVLFSCLAFCLITTGHIPMLRISELKLPLERLFEHPGAAQIWSRDAQNLNTSEWLSGSVQKTGSTAPTPSPVAEPTQAAHNLDPNAPAVLIEHLLSTFKIAQNDIAQLIVFKRSFDARKTPLQVVYIVDLQLKQAALEAQLLEEKFSVIQVLPCPDMTWSPSLDHEVVSNAPKHGPASSASHAAHAAPADPQTLGIPHWQPGAFDDAPKIERLQQAFAKHRSSDAQATQGESHPPRPVVVGFGPCGIFAALILAQLGLKPIVIERGKKVRERTKDTWGLWRKGVLQTSSNVQFGEGGAGTFSDGKLYSQTKDPRFLGRKVMQEFVKAGAPEEILFAAHPHIGTFKLVKVVESLREQIIALGGEIRFGQQMVNLDLEGTKTLKATAFGGGQTRQLKSALIFDEHSQTTYTLPCQHLVLALGHSARETFARLYDLDVPMLAKPFSVGFRIEHPQGLIDRARWGKHAGHPLLGAADYKLVHHAKNQRSVYSFCMCPGGTVVAATSENNRVVTNGMSQYSRNERNANAAIVVGIEPEDFRAHQAQIEDTFQEELGRLFPGSQPLALKPHAKQGAASLDPSWVHPLSGVVLQRQLESRAFVMGGQNYQAPAQLVGDFLTDQASSTFAQVLPSYKPGVHLTNLSISLPSYATDAIREALPAFGKKVAGFDLPGALLTGVETRTSSPLRILRDESFQSTGVHGLYPAGEGAGFAGGILTAAMDGIKVAEALANQVLLASNALEHIKT